MRRPILDVALIRIASLLSYSFSTSAISAVNFPEESAKLAPLGLGVNATNVRWTASRKDAKDAKDRILVRSNAA
jgi:hypothetical protein